MRYFLDIPRIIDGSGAHPDAASPPVEGCGEHGGEESGEPRGARWGAPWGGEWGTPWDSVESAMGRIAERAMGSARGGWGFCTIRRIATACRRRVASLLVQFPPSQRPERAEPNERAGTRHPPRGARRGGKWSTPWSPPGTHGGFAPLDASLRRVAGVSHPYWCNSPLAVGSTLGRRVGNPVGHGGERAGGHGGEARSCPHRQRSGGASTRTPATRPGNESGQSSFFRSSQRRS